MLRRTFCFRHHHAADIVTSGAIRSNVSFVLNGKRVTIDKGSVNPRQTLLEYLRAQGLTGTKLVCGEGGCGACTVMLTRPSEASPRTVNACLMPVCAADGCAVTTIEGCGTSKNPHPVQEAMAKNFASQCGYCSPGMAVAMVNELNQEGKQPTVYDMEHCIQGNLCRCTGYRPLLDVAKMMATSGEVPETAVAGAAASSSPDTKFSTTRDKVVVHRKDGIKSTVRPQNKVGAVKLPESVAALTHDTLCIDARELNESAWHRPSTLAELAGVCLEHKGGAMCSAGFTEINILKKNRNNHVFVLTSNVPELNVLKITDPKTGALEIGAAVTLSRLCEFADAAGATAEDAATAASASPLKVLATIRRMLQWFASKQIRNVATIGGNVVNASPISDLNPIFLATGATFKLYSAAGGFREVAASSFFTGYRKTAMAKEEVLVSVSVPGLAANEYVQCFKQSRRREDDISIVTACFKARFDGGKISNVNCGFGGLAATSVLSASVASALNGVDPSSELLQGQQQLSPALVDKVCAAVEKDFPLAPNVPGGMPVFRQTLAASFAFKFVADIALKTNKNNGNGNSLASSRVIEKIAGTYMDAGHAPLTHGVQEFQQAVSGGLTLSAATRDAEGDSMLWQDITAVPGTSAERGVVGAPESHRSALLHCTGEATFVDDMPVTRGGLHGAFVLSARPSGKIKRIDVAAASSFAGVAGVFTAKDIDAKDGNVMGPAVNKDEELFRSEFVTSIGQPVALVVAESLEQAETAARQVTVEYEAETPESAATLDYPEQDASYGSMHPPAFSIEQSSKLGRWRKKGELVINDGNMADGWTLADVTVEGELRMGGQEHFYLEPQSAVCVPGEGGRSLQVYTSAQETRKAQAFAAKVTGLPAHRVVSHVTRMGGGFGGKETRAVFVSTAAALAAHKLQRQVRVVLDRDVDMVSTGMRHPFWAKYKVGATRAGKLTAVEVDIRCNAGYSLDLSEPVLGRAVFHVDNAYKLPNASIIGRLCYTNTVTNTAFRGFGGPQGMFVAEAFMDHLAAELKLDPHAIRQTNLYSEAQSTHYNQVLHSCTLRRLWAEVMERGEVEQRSAAVRAFNAAPENRYVKRGIRVIPTKFGINFTAKFMNQGQATAQVYAADGTVLIACGGTEMGQGLYTKLTQIAARSLGISIDRVFVEGTSSDKIPNAIPTAASSGTDVYGMALLHACEQLNARLEPYKRKVAATAPAGATADDIFKAAAEIAFFDRVNLSASGFYKNPRCGFDWSLPVPPGGSNSIRGTPFGYFSNGAACSEVEVDTLTGDARILRTDIVMDLGNSINPAIDIGQIEGAFVQGYGWCMLEEAVWGTGEEHAWLKPGNCFTRGPGSYKIPTANDVPIDFRVSLLRDAPNSGRAVHSSKAVGEPPYFMSTSAFFAARDAIRAARIENLGLEEGSKYFALHSPLTPERIRGLCGDSITERFAAAHVKKGGSQLPSLFC